MIITKIPGVNVYDECGGNPSYLANYGDYCARSIYHNGSKILRIHRSGVYEEAAVPQTHPLLNYQPDHQLVMTDKDTIWMFDQIGNGEIQFHKFIWSKPTLTEQIYGKLNLDEDLRLVGALELPSGNILCATCKNWKIEDGYVRTQYYTVVQPNGNQSTLIDTISGKSSAGLIGTFAVHPEDNRIWCFFNYDGSGIFAKVLVESNNQVYLDQSFDPFIPAVYPINTPGENYYTHGENTYVSTCVSGGMLYIAYPDNNTKLVYDSLGYFHMLAKTNIQIVEQNGELTPVMVIPEWTDRVGSQNLGSYNGLLYLVIQPFQSTTEDKNYNTTICYLDGTKVDLGILAPYNRKNSDTDSLNNINKSANGMVIYPLNYGVPESPGEVYFCNMGEAVDPPDEDPPVEDPPVEDPPVDTKNIITAVSLALGLGFLFIIGKNKK